MKISKYNVLVPVEHDKKILYNTISRKYISYSNSDEKLLISLMKNLNKGKYSAEELKYLKEMICKGIVIRDDIDEIDKIRSHQDEVGFQGQCFFVAVLPIIIGCSFKLTYYWKENKKIHMNEGSEEDIIKFIDDLSKKAVNIEIGWFGEEVVLRFHRILSLTKKFEDICEKNNCGYRELITADGYLLTNEIIDRFFKLNLYKIQIVLEGNIDSHKRNLHLKNRHEKYDSIKENILKLSNKDIFINLRIDVNEENYHHITELLDIVPQHNRHKINIHFCNKFKNKKILPLFNIYEAAIGKGYKYFDTKNSYSICEVCMKSGFKIESTGRIVPCFTIVENEMCREDIPFSMCMLEEKHIQYRNHSRYNREGLDELSFHEKIKLHYYSDMMQIRIKRIDSIKVNCVQTKVSSIII